MDDSWRVGLMLTDADRAKGELDWLEDHNHIREYLLVRRSPPSLDLDDEIPF